MVVELNLQVCHLAAHDLNELQSDKMTRKECVSRLFEKRHGNRVVLRSYLWREMLGEQCIRSPQNELRKSMIAKVSIDAQKRQIFPLFSVHCGEPQVNHTAHRGKKTYRKRANM